jgi:hypothetical protein
MMVAFGITNFVDVEPLELIATSAHPPDPSAVLTVILCPVMLVS